MEGRWRESAYTPRPRKFIECHIECARARAHTRTHSLARIVSIHRLSVKWAKIIVWINHRPRHVVHLLTSILTVSRHFSHSFIVAYLSFLSLLLFLSEFPFLNSWTNRVYKRVKRTKEESPGFSVKIGRSNFFLNPVLRSIVARSKSIDLDVYKKRRSVPRWLSLWRNVYNTKFQP